MPPCCTDDFGFDTLANAIAAGAGKSVHILRDWTITAPVTIPANTEIVVESVITQTTNDSSIFLIQADNVTLRGAAGGKLIGTNTETPNSATVYIDGSTNFTVRDLRIQGSRGGLVIRGGALNGLVDGVRCYGGDLGPTSNPGGNSFDYLLYNPAAGVGRRIAIVNCFALGNLDLGISCNNIAGDDQVTIANNFVCPCDTAGEVQRPHNTARMRYGIITSYNGGEDNSCIVADNHVVGCAYSGIYKNGAAAPAGTMILNGNLVEDCGFGIGAFDGTDAGLRGAIQFHGPGRVTGDGNVIRNCWAFGLKLQGYDGFAAANAMDISLGCTIEGTKDATITASNASAVYIAGTKPANLFLRLNVRHGGAGVTGPALLGAPADVDSGSITIEGKFRVTGIYGAIYIDGQVGGTDTDATWYLENLTLEGSDNATNNGGENAGINFTGNVQIRNVTIDTFYRGLSARSAISARRLDRVVDNIVLRNLTLGIANGGTGTIIVQNPTVDNVSSTVFAGSYMPGTKVGANIRIMSAGIPGSGVFAEGDVCENLTVASGQPHSWGYDGGSSTWVSRGNFA